MHLLKNDTPGLAIVFCATRKETGLVSKNLKRQNINAKAIHGGMGQDKRLRSLNSFKKEDIDVLVATNVAARGIDIENVTHIYHYDVPRTPTEYIHRIGRTARAGENGTAVTLLTRPDHDNFRRVQRDDKLEIEREEVPDFKKVSFDRRRKGKKKSFRKRGRGSYS